LARAAGALAAVIGLAAAAAGLALGPADAASSSLGSVPAEVSSYVSSGAMVARLNDVYGPNASGTRGIKFDDTTKAGPISRVYEWTADRLANRATTHPVQLTNNWVVPITIGGASVGLATIWINPQTVDAELAEFSPSASLGTALSSVPATAALVRDTTTGAWLALADGTVTPLVAGRSGLTKPTPVGSLKLAPTAPAPLATTEPNTGLALAIGIVALLVIIIVVALLLPRGRRTKTAKGAVPSAAAAAPLAAPLVAADDLEPKPAATSPSTPATPTKPSAPRPQGTTPTTSGAAKPASSKPPVSRQSAPRTASTRPASTAGASKPAASKPAASKPPASKPPATKPPASKPPAPKQPPRPRTPKPPIDDVDS